MVRRMLIALIVLAAATATAAPNASANFADSQSGNCYYSYVTECYADSSKHDFYWDLGTRGETAVFSTLFGSYDTTTLDVSLADGHTSSVDVFYDYGDIPDIPEGAVVGLWSCQRWTTSSSGSPATRPAIASA